MTDRIQSQLRSRFPESLLTGYKHLIVNCGNQLVHLRQWLVLNRPLLASFDRLLTLEATGRAK